MVSRSGQALVVDCISHKARWKTVRQKYISFTIVFFGYFEPFYPEARRLNFTCASHSRVSRGQKVSRQHGVGTLAACGMKQSGIKGPRHPC
jgi:hypothetical protein